MIREYRAAVLDRLAPWRVVDDRSRVADKVWPAPWLVVDFPPPLRASDRWEASGQHRVVGWFQTSAVGEDQFHAGALHDVVADVLVDWVPLVPGWTVWPVEMDTAPRLLGWDRTVPDRVLVQVVTRWSWTATRALP